MQELAHQDPRPRCLQVSEISEKDTEVLKVYEIIIICLLGCILLWLISNGLLHKYYLRAHRNYCRAFLLEFVANIERLQGRLHSPGFYSEETSPDIRPEASDSNGNSSDNTPAGIWTSNVWAWGIEEGGTTLERKVDVDNTKVRIVVCVQDDHASNEKTTNEMQEMHKNKVFQALQLFSNQMLLVPSRISCCIISDSEIFPGVLTPGERIVDAIGHEFYTIRHFVRNFARTSIDVLPVFCDVADYCLLIVPSVPTARMALDSAGPTFFMTALSTLALKSERQGFIIEGSFVHKIDERCKKFKGLPIPTSLQGVNLCGGLLHLYALAVSHGSYSFVETASTPMATVDGLDIDAGSRFWRFFCRCSKNKFCKKVLAATSVSLPHEVDYLFRTELHDRPITFKGRRKSGFAVCHSKTHGSSVSLDSKKSLSKVATQSPNGAYFGQEVSVGTESDSMQLKGSLRSDASDEERTYDVETCILLRRKLRHAAIINSRVTDAAPNFALPVRGSRVTFPVTRQIPCAMHLVQIAEEIDALLEGDEEDLYIFEDIAPLSLIASRIQSFCVAALQKMNGTGIEELAASNARMAAFDAYTHAVEHQGHVVDLAREFLCDRSEPQAFKSLSKQADELKDGKQISADESLNMQDCDTVVVVTVVRASKLRNADAGFGGASDPYCTVEIKDKPRSRVESHHVDNSSSPTWNFETELDYTFGDSLSFKVWDKDLVFKGDDFLGEAELTSVDFDSGSYEGELELGDPLHTEDNVEFGTLQVAVRVEERHHLTERQRHSMTSTLSEAVQSHSDRSAHARTNDNLHSFMLHIKTMHQTVNKIMKHIVTSVNRESMRQHHKSKAVITQSNRATFFGFVQRCLRLTLEDRLSPVLPEHMDLMQRQQQDHVVTDALEAIVDADEFLIPPASVRSRLKAGEVYVETDSFYMMKAILEKIADMKHLSVRCVRNSWHEAKRTTPLIVVSVSVVEHGVIVEDSPIVKIKLAHSMISSICQNTENSSYSADLLEEVPKICRTLRIEDPNVHPSMWCISLGQLKEIAQLSEKQLGPAKYKESRMYDIVRDIVKPACAVSRMSYARMMNWQKLKRIDVFISHCWKENFQTFVETVDKALCQRLSYEDTCLWICSFALFQTTDRKSVSEQIGNKLLMAPFDKALRHSTEVLVVRNSEVDNFTRAWCVYEIFRAQQLNLKITVAGPEFPANNVVDILSCTASNKADEEKIKKTIQSAGLVDEINSVVDEIRKKGWEMDVRPGDTDRAMCLNCILAQSSPRRSSGRSQTPI